MNCRVVHGLIHWFIILIMRLRRRIIIELISLKLAFILVWCRPRWTILWDLHIICSSFSIWLIHVVGVEGLLWRDILRDWGLSVSKRETIGISISILILTWIILRLFKSLKLLLLHGWLSWLIIKLGISLVVVLEWRVIVEITEICSLKLFLRWLVW